MYAGTVHNVTRGINRATKGVNAKIVVHVCFGNLYGRPFGTVRNYRNLGPVLADLRASQVVLEFANRGMADLERLKDFPRDKKLGAGVIEVKAFKAETADDVAERVRAVLAAGISPERLWLTPDCGFWETPRQVCRAKLRALVDGVAAVRRELAA
jgi:5-methyltetrahydropteroyltriglutamate--homocysteine methyltransferase